MALIVLGAVLAAVQEELRQGDVPVAGAGLRSRFPLDLVHEAAEPDETLLHLLVPVVPRLLRRGADVIRPAVAELLCRVVQTEILAIRHHVVVDRRLDEVAGDVALVIPPVGHGPPLPPGSPPACGRLVGARRVAQRERRLQVAVGMLRGQDLRDPVLEGRAQLLLRRDDLLIALRVDHQRQADGLDRLVHPRVREDVALVRGVRFAAQSLRGLDEVVDAAVASPGGDVGAVALVDAVRNPRGDQGLDPGRPERARHRVGPRDHETELLGRRRQLHLHDEGRGRFRRTVVGRHLEDVLARRRESEPSSRLPSGRRTRPCPDPTPGSRPRPGRALVAATAGRPPGEGHQGGAAGAAAGRRRSTPFRYVLPWRITTRSGPAAALKAAGGSACADSTPSPPNASSTSGEATTTAVAFPAVFSSSRLVRGFFSVWLMNHLVPLPEPGAYGFIPHRTSDDLTV